jgi:hypothetical protein
MKISWFSELFKKSQKASDYIREQAVNKQKYLHKENNPDRVYFSSESPGLKKWCNEQMKRNKDTNK